MIRHDSSNDKGGKLSSYNSCRPLTKDEPFLLLDVDDGSIIFTNRDKMQFFNLQMKRRGLNMHVEMFFPSKETIQIWTEEHKKATLPSTTLPIIDSDAPNKFKSG